MRASPIRHLRRMAGDSNLDWGQGLARLGRYLEANGIEKVYLRCFGTTSPEVAGIRNFHRLEPMDRPRGWVAVSVTILQGRYRLPGQAGFDWREAHEKGIPRRETKAPTFRRQKEDSPKSLTSARPGAHARLTSLI